MFEITSCSSFNSDSICGKRVSYSSTFVFPFLAYSVSVYRKFVKAEGAEFNKLIGLSSLESLFFSVTVILVLIMF